MAASCKTWRILILWVVLYFLCVDVVCWSKSIPEVGDKEDELEEQRMRDQDYQDLLSAYPESQPDDGQESPRLSRWAMPASGVIDSQLRCPPGSRPHPSGTHCVYDTDY